jgi:hypothetical protein
MIKLLLLFTGSLFILAGCSSPAPMVVEKPILVERPSLMIQVPQPAEQYDFEWVVITKDNAEARFKELEAKGVVVLFALTPNGYQNLSMGGAELRRYIQQQQSVIAAYKAYYDKPKEAEKPKEKVESTNTSWKLW